MDAPGPTLHRPGTPISGTDGRGLVAGALGACVGVSGIDHGIFEMLQGNSATPGFLIPAIGPDQLMWEHGTEDAFTIVPNFLLTGILAVLFGLLTLAWSIWFIDSRHGAKGLLVLGALTFAVGGGIGMLVFLLFGFVVARNIGRPPRRSRLVPDRLRAAVSKRRRGLVGLGFVLFLMAVQIAITGYVPGMSDPDRILAVCWSLLGGSLALFAASLIGTGVEAPAARPDVHDRSQAPELAAR